jgi:hypothetical protein
MPDLEKAFAQFLEVIEEAKLKKVTEKEIKLVLKSGESLQLKIEIKGLFPRLELIKKSENSS